MPNDQAASTGLPAAGQSQETLIPGAAGHIEALIAAPRTPARDFAVVCHPHPLFGGALSNKVTYALASCALKAGLYAVRFNFRGVGRSQGLHDEGRGETDDTVRVVEWIRERLPQGKVLLAGFSFGAYVSLKAAAHAHPDLQVSVAPPFGKYFGGEPAPPRPACPWLVVHGRDDDVVSYTETQTILAQYEPPPELVTLDGTGHYFHARLGDLQNAVLDFLHRHWARA